MVDGIGTVYGAFIITGLDEEGSMFVVNGLPQKTDFTLTLVRGRFPGAATAG